MSYDKLIEALRILQDKNSLSYYKRQVCKDAADAIEELKDKPWVESVQIDKLRQRIDELEEKQTYCDAYGDKWMTGGKDVPTEAYKHGYMDGMDEAKRRIEAANRLLDQNTQRCEALRKQLREAHESYERHLNELEAQLPNRGEWIMDGKYSRHCSICNESVVWPEKYCPNCGAKMEVQE